MKRNEYDDEIPFHCNSCSEDYTIEGYVHSFGDDEVRIIPAEGSRGDWCPNDEGIGVDSYWSGRHLVPTHDTNWTGETR